MNAERRLPRWYLDAVNVAADVFAGAPATVDKSIPFMGDPRGVQSQREGRAASFHPSPPVNVPAASENVDGER